MAKTKVPYLHRAIILDIDQVQDNKARFDEVLELARSSDVHIIWQQPCHEAFLLRHFAGYERDDPANSAISEQRLVRVWPEYRKPMTKMGLSKQIKAAELERVSAFHAEFAALLRLGQINPLASLKTHHFPLRHFSLLPAANSHRRVSGRETGSRLLWKRS